MGKRRKVRGGFGYMTADAISRERDNTGAEPFAKVDGWGRGYFIVSTERWR